MSAFTTKSVSTSKFGIGARQDGLSYQPGMAAAYYQNQTGLMEMDQRGYNGVPSNSQNYNSSNVDPHELATRAAKNATMAAAALPETARQYSASSSRVSSQGLSVRTLQNVLDRQYEGFLQVAARIAQIHEKADHLRNMYLHMSMEETAYATGAQQANAARNRGSGGTISAAAGYTTSRRMKDPFRDADLKEKQLKANETRRVERRKKILYQRNMMGGAMKNGLAGTTTTANGGINGGGGGAAMGSLVGNNTGFGGSSNTLALGNGATGGGLFGQSTSGSGGGLFNNSNKPAGGGGLFGGGSANAGANKAGGLFGSSAAKPAIGGGLFGGAASNTTGGATGGGLFGGASTSLTKSTSLNSGGGGLFGGGGGLFGKK